MLVGPFVTHLAAEVFGLRPEDLDSEVWVADLLRKAVVHLSLRLVEVSTTKFELGVTGIAVVTESHIAVHTWPEYGYVHIDLVTCASSNTQAIKQFLNQALTDEAKVNVVDLSAYLLARSHDIPIGYPQPPQHVTERRLGG